MGIRARLAIGAVVLVGIGVGAAIPAAAVSKSTEKKFIAAIHHAAPATKHVSNKKLLGLASSLCAGLGFAPVSDAVGILKESSNAFHFPKNQVVPIVATSVSYFCPSHKGAVVAYEKHPSTTPPTQSAAPPTTKPPAASSGGGGLDQQAQVALQQAKQYLQTQAFSQAGLIAQLDSPDGGGFSVADATAAVDSMTNVNWNNEAVQAAKSYMKLEPMSCAGLVQQLDSSSGDQYTYAQAVYGAEQAGDCPNGAPTGATGSSGSTGSTGGTP